MRNIQNFDFILKILKDNPEIQINGTDLFLKFENFYLSLLKKLSKRFSIFGKQFIFLT